MSDHSNWNENDGFVGRQIHRVSRNLLIWNGVALGGMAIIILLLRTYLISFLQGPQLADDTYILNAAKGSGSGLIAYVEMRDRKLIPTGYVEESTQNGRVYSTMNYDFVAVGDKLMLVKATKDARGDKLLGPLQFFSAQSDRQALDAVIAKNPALRDRVLPVMLNAAAAFNVFGYILIGVFTPIFVLCTYSVARAILKGKTNLHPVMRSLARRGDAYELTQAIDAEMATNGVLKVGKAFITRNWLLRPTVFGLIACQLDDIVWAFHSVIKGSNIASFAFRDGKMIGIPLQRNTPELLARVYERVPWVERGWDKGKAKRWRTDRTSFLEQVEARRNERQA
jgi:hypothetical protein